MAGTVRSIACVAWALLALAISGGCSPAGSGNEERAGGAARLQVVEGPTGGALAFVHVRVRGRGPFPFVLDTGASQSLVDRRIARRAELPVVARDRPVAGVSGVGSADVARVEQWRLGDLELPSVRAAVVDLPDAPPPLDGSPWGLLGSDVLSRYGVATIDYERRRLRLGRGQAPGLGGWPSVELRVEEGPSGSVLAFVTVFIGDRDEGIPFAIDTGASHSVLDTDLSESLGLQTDSRSEPVTGIVGGGKARMARLERWRLQGVALPATRVAVIDFPETPAGIAPRFPKGLLGSDVLRGFGVVVVDYGKRRLSLRPRG